MARWLVAAVSAAAAAYPVIVYLSLEFLSVTALGSVLLGLALARLLLVRRAQQDVLLVAATVAAMALAGGYTLVGETALGVRLYPVLMSVAMLALFAWSLTQEQSIIERFARLVHRDLSPAAIRYTRRVTAVWCGFFTLNGAIALWTALEASWAVWTLYNGLISYVLIATLLLAELWFRERRAPAA